MLLLVQIYGFTHVCAHREFEIEVDPSLKNQATDRISFMPYLNYPYLDIHIQRQRDIERIDIGFYFRGALDQEREAEFQNLFEYLLSRSFVGTGFPNFFI